MGAQKLSTQTNVRLSGRSLIEARDRVKAH